MSDTVANHPRERLREAAKAILAVLPGMGRVMLTTREGGATHERMGLVQSVDIDGTSPWVQCRGEHHDSSIDTSVVGSVIADRTMTMKDKVLPRLDFQDSSGETLFSVIGLDGLQPFDAALAGFQDGEPLAPAEKAGGTPPAIPTENDAGGQPLEAACASGLAISIEMRRPGLRQAWSGRIETVKPAMGFINVMQPDFHLHLRDGSVGHWRRGGAADSLGEIELHAEDPSGRAFGLILRGPEGAFASASGGDRVAG